MNRCYFDETRSATVGRSLSDQQVGPDLIPLKMHGLESPMLGESEFTPE